MCKKKFDSYFFHAAELYKQFMTLQAFKLSGGQSNFHQEVMLCHVSSNMLLTQYIPVQTRMPHQSSQKKLSHA